MTTDRDFDVTAYNQGLEEGRREAMAYIEETSRLRVKIARLEGILSEIAKTITNELKK
jgi:hypothetical protein